MGSDFVQVFANFMTEAIQPVANIGDLMRKYKTGFLMGSFQTKFL